MTAETSNARGEWVLVPREPTPEMLVAINWPNDPAGYRAMLAAAPPPADAEPKTLPVPTRVHLIGETAVIVGTPERGWDEDAQDAHNCDAMGCASIGPHVLARVPFTDERAMLPPAVARGDVRYDRELIAQMLDAAESLAFTMEEMDRQARLLREAARAKPEARGVVDEAMVDRAGQALYGTDWGSFDGREADQLRRKVRAVLTAALTEARNG